MPCTSEEYAEFSEFQKQYHAGEIAFGFDRALAREFYTNISAENIRKLVEESPSLEKAIVMSLFVLPFLLLVSSLIVAGFVFRWWATLAIPLSATIFFVYYGISSRGNVGIFYISVILIGNIIFNYNNIQSSDLFHIYLLLLIASLFFSRLLYVSSSFFFRALLLRNANAYIKFKEAIIITRI